MHCYRILFLCILAVAHLKSSLAGFRSCFLRPEVGSCRGYFPRWFYNSTSARCERFIYGGCQGNPNRFETRESCESACICDRCNFQPETGPCEAYIPSSFYNVTSGNCEQFIYGGCGGNDNRFRTAAECVAHCSKESTCPVRGQVFGSCPSCQGTCDNPSVQCPLTCNDTSGCVCPPGQLVDTDAKKCVHPTQCPINCSNVQCPEVNCVTGEPIIPPGSCCPVCVCKNGDGFYLPGEPFRVDCNGCSCTSSGLSICTLIACEATVTEPPSPPSNVTTCPIEGQEYTECGTACPPTCKTPIPFPCTAECVKGCQCPAGTVLDEQNNTCVEHCSIPPCESAVAQCRLQPDPGPCEALTMRYFWNYNTRQCEEFNYGGCEGNPNNFLDQRSCENQCACADRNCPTGSQCKVDELTGQSYCEPSCLIDNGGCPSIQICSLRNVTCITAPCPPVVDCRCPAEDQVYNECGSACAPTCRERNPRPCTLQCVAGCQCPNDTVLDEESNKCVTVDQCPAPCPPVCSHEYCSGEGNRNKPCSRPPPNSIPACPDRCYSTYCRACYYSRRPRKTPRQCNDDMCTNRVKPVCLKKWAKCVYRQNRKKNKCRGNCITAGNFQCYDYPTCTNLRG